MMTASTVALWLSVCMPVTRAPQRHGNSVRQLGKAVFQRRRKRGEPPQFFPRQTWCSSWAVTRTHHTHCLCSHPQMRSLKIACPPLRLSLTLHHLHVNFSPGCHLPTQSSIFLAALLSESEGCPWSRCWYCCSVQGWSHLTGIHSYICNAGQFQDVCAFWQLIFILVRV